MRRRSLVVLISLALVCTTLASAQSFAPPPVQKPEAGTLKAINDKIEQLGKELQELIRLQVPDDALAHAEIYHKAAVWITRHDEWYHKDYPRWTLESLDRGLERARFLKEKKPASEWLLKPGRVAGGYVSLIDGSVQPIGLILPSGFGKDPTKKYRMDVVLHGRDASLTEVKFLHQNDASQVAPDQDYIQLNIYGRGNNAYRYAGEVDVFEAIANVARLTGAVDPRRIVLRGFSMGGAGAWHLGLHHPTRWCSVSPGAGFSTTRGYVKSLPDRLPEYQEACLHIYDAVDYAENAFNVPVVAYGGDKDPQLQAARNIEERLKGLKIPLTLLVGPNTEHKYHPDSLKEIMRLQGEHAAKGRITEPDRVRFVTHSWCYPCCHWVNVLAPVHQYQRVFVEGERQVDGLKVKTENVRTLRLFLAPSQKPMGDVSITIDGQNVVAKAWPSNNPADGIDRPCVLLEKRQDRWIAGLWPKYARDVLRGDAKNPELSGPIDLVFTGPFLCVRGTGKGWHSAPQKYVEADLKRFQAEWNKYFRGDLPVVDDVDLSPIDLETRHLILFGDPSSNSWIREVIDRLPIRWNSETIEFGGDQYSSSNHVPVMCYPSPFGVNRYVVLNSGHTFHKPDFEGTNALLYPRLGDHAILKVTEPESNPLAVEVVRAGLFDEFWRVSGGKRQP